MGLEQCLLLLAGVMLAGEVRLTSCEEGVASNFVPASDSLDAWCSC